MDELIKIQQIIESEMCNRLLLFNLELKLCRKNINFELEIFSRAICVTLCFMVICFVGPFLFSLGKRGGRSVWKNVFI